MTAMTIEKLCCPEHGDELVGVKTKFGVRHNCPVDGCTVRCWAGSTSTPCDRDTATLRNACHNQFDPLWGAGGVFTRRPEAYGWLRVQMKLSRKECHFGMFSAEQCKEALAHIRKLKKKAPAEQGECVVHRRCT